MLDASIVHRTDDDQLVVQLDGGASRAFEDSESYFVAVEYLSEQHGLVIYEQRWEGGSYGYLDLSDGSYQPLTGYPLFSDNGAFVLVTNVDLDAGYSPNVLQIWRFGPDEFQLAYDAEPEHWGPVDVKWTDARTVSFAVGTISCELFKEGPCRRGLLKREADDWSIQLPATVK